ncbi:MAG: hypothetical protein IKB13_05945, partial [Clostridia bacterium]|nr:hypothetical protein [Clostridia bacterium]
RTVGLCGAFLGIILFGMLVRCPIKISAILPEITAMETCNTSQVMLTAKPQINFHFIVAVRLA